MHGLGGEKWKQSRHMWPVPNTTVAVDSSCSEFICQDGRKIRIGDCALFKPPQDSPPFIGIIRRLTVKKDDSPSLGVNWLYRPADVKLAKGILLEAAPNEVFYSFHKDEIPAASLLHPCKVSFLRKGVELPPGISSFVCRRVYDIENKCLWWLTDKDYINERQEEVDKLLDKTRIEMHGAVQSGGRSPKPLNGPPSTPSLKSGSDSVQNSSPFGSQVKGKKRERVDQGSDSCKRERSSKAEDGDSCQFRPDNMLRSEIAKITDKGGLVDFEGVEKLVQLMQPDSADKKIDLAGRIMLVDVIAFTDRFDCLGWFVQLRGLPVLDEWLQEAHKGKIGDSSSPKESDKSVEEFLLALLRALDKLPVNLHALQTCNVGKSVNHLRTHRNSEIQKKARSLVDTWKKRVEAEMNITDPKSGSSRGVSWPTKSASSEASQVGNKKTGGLVETVAKNSVVLASVSKSSQAKLGGGEAFSKPTASPGSTKSIGPSVGNSKDQNFRILVGSGTSELPLTPIKEEKSSGSSQSQNNSLSCSSDFSKALGSACREDARSSTAGSVNVSRVLNSASRPRKSSNGLHGSTTVVQKESSSGKLNNTSRNSSSEKVSPTGVSHEKLPDVPLIDHGNNQRLIVKLPNSGRSPVRGASGGSLEDPAVSCGRASPPAEKDDNHDKRVKEKSDSLQPNVSSNTNTDVSHDSEVLTGYEEGQVTATREQCHAAEDGEKVSEMSKPGGLSSDYIPRSEKTYDASLSSIDALIESCVKFSEASASVSPGDDVGMNLLASVAAGEMSKSENVSPLASPARGSHAADESCSGSDGKLKHSDEVAQTRGQPDDVATGEHAKTIDSLWPKNETHHLATHMSNDLSGDSKGTLSGTGDKLGNWISQSDFPPKKFNSVDGTCLRSDVKPGDLACEASVPEPSAEKQIRAEPEGVSPSHDQREFGAHGVRNSDTSDSKLKVRISSFDEDQKVEHMDERTVENCKASVPEGTCESAMIKEETNEKSPGSSSDLGDEKLNTVEKLTSTSPLTPQKHSHVVENSQSLESRNSDVLSSLPDNPLDIECKADNTEDMKPGQIEQGERLTDLGSSFSADISEYADEKVVKKEALGHSSSSLVPDTEPPRILVQEIEGCKKSLGCNSDEVDIVDKKEWHASSVDRSLPAAGSDMAVKLDFDLNEGFPVDDGSQGEILKSAEPVTSSAVHMPCPLPFPISSMSGGFHSSITVAAAAKGPFVPPENLLRNKGELGWKGSAATSAFRPAEPRKNTESLSNTSDVLTVDTTSTKQGRPPLDFDLNVPGERIFEDAACQSSSQQTCSESGHHDRGIGGLDLDLNRIDETPDVGSFSVSKLDIHPLPSRPSLPGGLSNGGVGVSRDFDLNNGPGLDEVDSEAVPRIQHIKSTMPFASAVHGVRMNSADFGNFSSWFPSGNSYSAITVPPLLPSRGEQNYVTAAGTQRILGPPGSTSFGPEIYRGPVLPSSPAVAYPPTTPFQYPGFPFETNFPLASNSFSGCTTAYMDSSSGGALCFPTIPSQLVAPGGIVSSTYPRPYVMSLSGSTSNVLPESRKWGPQGLDLNTGPGGTDAERREERLSSSLRQLSVPSSQALVEEQMKMFQVAGGILKRKEPDSGWDGIDRYSYKHPSWQ
ncbi:BAH domain-containing protein [Quillaja saponaria]|uniref:BAH domain-containing protein n=1 Tax=Quillaja saponaria TaxID=32244 RepID=A0AAD7Q439_QUISA|nr:BAH domain-containing protein [Quillaja saponaria]KAJ7974520.1 BAH domain-containing protein [Quillaja saponaria]